MTSNKYQLKRFGNSWVYSLDPRSFNKRKRFNFQKAASVLLMVLLILQTIIGALFYPPIKEAQANPDWLSGWSH